MPGRTSDVQIWRLSVKHTNAIARTTSHHFCKHTISSFAKHTSATTYASAIGNAIFFQNCYIFVAPVVAPHILCWKSRRCVDSQAIVMCVVASHVACLIALNNVRPSLKRVEIFLLAEFTSI